MNSSPLTATSLSRPRLEYKSQENDALGFQWRLGQWQIQLFLRKCPDWSHSQNSDLAATKHRARLRGTQICLYTQINPPVLCACLSLPASPGCFRNCNPVAHWLTCMQRVGCSDSKVLLRQLAWFLQESCRGKGFPVRRSCHQASTFQMFTAVCSSL